MNILLYIRHKRTIVLYFNAGAVLNTYYYFAVSIMYLY